MWNGIEAWGDINESQLAIPRSETAQAYIELNYCKIEDAITGVLLGERNNLSQIPDKTKSGGLIIANNTSFINNRVAVEFFPYQEYLNGGNIKLPNYSKFTNCHFQITDKLKDQTVLDLLNSGSQVILDKVKYVAFESCHFYTDKTLFEAAKRGTAIYAKETSLRIKNEEPSTFEGFTEAILVENTAPDGNTVYINNCIFTDNVHSIVLDAVDNVRLYNNDINVPNSEENNYINSSDQLERGYDNPVGIYIRKSIMNDIRKNDIDGSNPTTSLPHSYGIIINNCGGSAQKSTYSSNENYKRAKSNIGFGRIYNNTIEGLSYGLQAEYENGGSDNGNPSSFLINNGTGEDIKCNIFQNNIFSDIYLTGSSYDSGNGFIIKTKGELRNQGVCHGNTGPAGNTFSTSPTTNTNLDFSGNETSRDFYYRKYNNNSFPSHNPLLHIDNCTSINTNSQTCQDLYPCTDIGIPCLIDNIYEIRDNIVMFKQNITNTIDNGSTNDLLNVIEHEADDVISIALMDASPYLSDEVLLKLINKETKIEESYFEDIFIENCGLSDTVKIALEEYELSEIARSNINEVILTKSSRSFFYEELENLNYKLNIAQMELINYAIDNFDDQAYEDVLNSFDNNSLAELYKKYSWALYCGDYTEAENSLYFIGTIEESEELNSSIYNIAQLNFEKVSSENFHLSQNQIEDLRQNISKDSVSSISEIVFLKHYLGMNNLRIPVQQMQEFLSAKQKMGKDNQVLTKLHIYPNPASDNITIKLNIKSSGKIEIRNMLGELIKSKKLSNNYWINFDISKLTPGVYLVVFKEDNTAKVITNKLIIN